MTTGYSFSVRSHRARRAAGRPGRPPEAERAERRAERREALLDAAWAAVADAGERATMTAMAAAAGVTKPVLYRYFGDRAGLYWAIADRFAGGLLAELRAALAAGGPGRTSLERAIDAYLAYLEAHPGVYRFCVARLPGADPGAPRRMRGFLQAVAAEVEGALRAPLSVRGLDRRAVGVVAAGIVGMVHAAGERWLAAPGMSRPDAVRQLSELLWGGLSRLGAPAAVGTDA